MKLVYGVILIIFGLIGCSTRDAEIIKKHCSPANNVNYVAGSGECLRIITFNQQAQPKASLSYCMETGLVVVRVIIGDL